jgi:diacylglycerol kinase (ATP)
MAGTPLIGPSMTQPSPFKSTGGLLRIARAFGYSLQGLGAAWRHEAAFRQETALAVVLIPLGLWLGDTALERLLLAGMPVLVLIVELLNSAIEALADAISTDHHPLLGRAKDIGSAAVLLTLLLTGAAWAAVLVPRWWPS